MTVFVIQQPRPNKKTGWVPDLSSATEYGELEYIFDPHERCYALPMPSLFKARRILRDKFDEEEDYILWPSAGDPVSVFAVCFAMADLNLSKVTILIWDRKRDENGRRLRDKGCYVPVKFTLREEKLDELSS